MSDYVEVLANASGLPIGERLQLIEDLWDSVPAEALPPLSEEWRQEINRRTADFDAGLAKATPWEQIRDAALRRAGVEPPDASR